MFLFSLCLAMGLDCGGAANAGGRHDPLRVGAAISLRDAMTEAANEFEKEGGAKVELTFGSSGQLLAQIRNGAPIDVFVSAAHEQIDTLERGGLTPPGARRVIAGNRLVLIVQRKPDVKLGSFEDLAAASVKRVAIGDPSTVPAGEYARQVLERLRLVEPLDGRLVYGANVRQVLDYVVRGEVSAGIVYATDAHAERDAVEIVATADQTWHAPIEYPAVVLKSSRNADEAEKFITFLVEEKAGGILERRGFSLPRRAATQPTSSRPRTESASRASESESKP